MMQLYFWCVDNKQIRIPYFEAEIDIIECYGKLFIPAANAIHDAFLSSCMQR